MSSSNSQLLSHIITLLFAYELFILLMIELLLFRFRFTHKLFSSIMLEIYILKWWIELL